MKVKLLRYTSDPERVCAAAAMTSYKSEGTSEIFEKLDRVKAEKVIRRVLGYGHFSVIEHASFTYSVEGVSRSLTHQLVRHRIASYTQQSQRYVKYNTLDYYVTPNSVEKTDAARKIFDEALRKITDSYQELLKLGVTKEDARYILPNAAKTNILVTMNARELMHASHLRLCQRAQWEIRELFEKMKSCLEEVRPFFASFLIPQCEYLGYCPEGDLSCGRTPTKKESLK
jgi:thymidylate synthase (FAD)